MFMVGALTDGKVRVLSDNAGVARWLQETIESVLFADFADTSVPVTPAVFARDGDPRGTVTELIETDAELVRMTWWNCDEPFVINAPAAMTGRPIGVYTTFFPARSAANLVLGVEGGQGAVRELSELIIERLEEKISSTA